MMEIIGELIVDFSATDHEGNRERDLAGFRDAAVYGGVYGESAVLMWFCSFFALLQVVRS